MGEPNEHDDRGSYHSEAAIQFDRSSLHFLSSQFKHAGVSLVKNRALWNSVIHARVPHAR